MARRFTADEALTAFHKGDGETVATYLEGIARSLPAEDRILLREIARALRPATEASELNEWRFLFRHRSKHRPDALETEIEQFVIGREADRRIRAAVYCELRRGKSGHGLQKRIIFNYADELNYSERTVRAALESYRRQDAKPSGYVARLILARFRRMKARL